MKEKVKIAKRKNIDIERTERAEPQAEVKQKRYRGFEVKVCLNGFIIIVGCQTLVAQSPAMLVDMVAKYMDDPEGYEKELRSKGFRFIENIPQPATSGTFAINPHEAFYQSTGTLRTS